MGSIVSQRSEDGVVSELLDGEKLRNNEMVNILWPDYFKESHKVMIVFEIMPSGVRERAHIKVSHHGISAPIALIHLISLGVQISRKALW